MGAQGYKAPREVQMVRVLLVAALAVSACKKDDKTGDSGTLSVGNLDAVTTSDRPSKRSEILAASHSETNSIMIFGGNEGPIVNQNSTGSFLGDTWVFEPAVGWFEATPSDSPKKRGRYAVSVDDDGNRALLFGGRFRKSGTSGSYDLFDDLWEFDFVTRDWAKLDTGGGPSGRYYPASAWDSGSGTYYVWGGATNSDPLVIFPSQELWAWDGNAWSEIETSGDAPSDRVFFGNMYDPARNRLVIYAGQAGDFVSMAFTDMYGLNLDNGEWKQLHDGGQGAPSSRMHGALTYDESRDRYLLFGGHTDIGDMNDLWAFDPETNEWSKEYIADKFKNTTLGCLDNPSEVPADYVKQDVEAPERRHRGLYAYAHDSVWVFAGIHAECSDYLDDTWRYDLATQTWVEIMEANSGESCERRNDDCECLCI